MLCTEHSKWKRENNNTNTPSRFRLVPGPYLLLLGTKSSSKTTHLVYYPSRGRIPRHGFPLPVFFSSSFFDFYFYSGATLLHLFFLFFLFLSYSHLFPESRVSSSLTFYFISVHRLWWLSERLIAFAFPSRFFLSILHSLLHSLVVASNYYARYVGRWLEEETPEGGKRKRYHEKNVETKVDDNQNEHENEKE